MCGRRESSIESYLKLKMAEAVSADYTTLCVCLKGMLTYILNCCLTTGDVGMCYGGELFIKLGLPVLAANPRILFMYS